MNDRVIARIGKPHGIRGEVTVQVHTDSPEQRLVPGAVFTTRARLGSGVPRELTLASVRVHRGIHLLSFEGIPDRTGAEGLRGTVLTLPDDPAGAGTADDGSGTPDDSAESADSWYEEELVGLSVVDPSGAPIGEITGLEIGAAQDLLVVRLIDGRTGRVPFVTQLVPVVDPAAGRVVVDAPGGLFELES